MTKPITVVLVGIRETLPDDLHAILAAAPEVSILGQSKDLRHGLSLLNQLTPAIAILGLSTLDKSAVRILKRVKAASPQTRPIIMATNFVEGHLASVFDAGCAGFILKERYASEITRAVLSVTVGRHYLGYPLFERVIEAYLAYGYSTFQNFPDMIPDFPR